MISRRLALTLRGCLRLVASVDAHTRAELLTAVCIAAVAGLAMMGVRAADPDRDMHHYFAEHHPVLLQVTRMCTFVLAVAVAFNVRFVVWHVGSGVLRSGAKAWQVRR